MSLLPRALVAILAGIAQVGAVPASRGPATRYSGPPPSYVTNQARADAVKQTFQISWDGYYQYAFPGDSLLPVTNTFENDRSVLTPNPLPGGEEKGKKAPSHDGLTLPWTEG